MKKKNGKREPSSSQKRLQVPITDEQLAEIDALVSRSGLRTRTALFDSALCLFDWAIDQSAKGRSIAAVDDDDGTFYEITMPALRNVAPSKESSLV